MKTSKQGYEVPAEVVTAIEVICMELRVNFDLLISHNSYKPYPDNRKILAHLLKLHFPKWSKSVNLARLMDRDHSSVLVMWQRAKNLIETEEPFREKVEKISVQIEAHRLNKPSTDTVEEMLSEMVAEYVITEGRKRYLLKAIKRETTIKTEKT